MSDVVNILGFTGTHHGMSVEQELALFEFLLTEQFDEFHHGDCIGADAQAATLAKRLNVQKIVRHPPLNDRARAFVELRPGDVDLPPDEYLNRNHAIVDACDLLVATPHGTLHPQCRHGTCATVRYAYKISRPFKVFFRSGRTE